jgi:hypothetical protein
MTALRCTPSSEALDPNCRKAPLSPVHIDENIGNMQDVPDVRLSA